MVETLAETRHLAVQFLLAGVGEGRMPDVVGQRQRFGEILIQRQTNRHRARNLRHFDGMCQAIAKVV